MSQKYKVALALSEGKWLSAYQDLVLGTRSLWFLILYELIMLLAQNTAGALGLWLRKKLYPLLLRGCGPDCVFGRGVILRHPQKITLGQGVMIDDNVLLDAKGQANQGLLLKDGVYIGRNSLIYTKEGNIELGPGVNVSANCILFSSNHLSVGQGTFVAAYSYLLSGGEYAIDSAVPMIEQPVTQSRGPTRIGNHVWIATHVVVTDGSYIQEGAVVGAGSVVRGEVPPGVLAAGAPAKVIRKLDRGR